ncbi:MAG TPA: hypothetical protein VLN49_16500 [Gemmatimonadaceae bacterium]|nr:hypothetical protein [Gemmatimonadaceae bacterium]
MKLVVAVVAALAPLIGADAVAQRPAPGSRVEDIYIVRSLRLSRTAPGEFCAEQRTGFPNPTVEDHYDFKAITARPADGRVTNANGSTVGHLHACLGATSDSLTQTFYAEGDLNGVRLTGRGDCRTSGRESPEPGIQPWRCYLELAGLPAGFTGGQLTTNTVVSRRTLGAVSDPVGYAQPSIATIRLWKKR